ncbi:MAG: glycosyltransferase [Sumerlaeia bacterium]
MAIPRLSVIIPVADRVERLVTCLESLAADAFAEPWELIVASDGGPLEMEGRVRELWPADCAPLHFFRLETRSGPARVRNFAVEKAAGQIILFLNDDVRLEPGFLAAHARAHAARPGHAVIGNTRWAPEVMTTDFMHWVAHHDSFYYLIDDPAATTWEYFHTLNASLDRSWFDRGERFDESFPDPAFEDTEFGFRLLKAGMWVTFAPAAIAYHVHYFDADDYLAKSWMRGKSARRLTRKFPELHERLVGEYEHAAARMRWRLRWREWRRLADGPEQWHARFALAFLAGYEGREPSRFARRCLA